MHYDNQFEIFIQKDEKCAFQIYKFDGSCGVTINVKYSYEKMKYVRLKFTRLTTVAL